jgi:hypothetical protein
VWRATLLRHTRRARHRTFAPAPLAFTLAPLSALIGWRHSYREPPRFYSFPTHHPAAALVPSSSVWPPRVRGWRLCPLTGAGLRGCLVSCRALRYASDTTRHQTPPPAASATRPRRHPRTMVFKVTVVSPKIAISDIITACGR